MEVAVRIADAVTYALNTTFAGDFVAQRRYVPKFRLEELGSLKVSVCPLTKTTALADRDSVFSDVSIQILFHKQTDPDELSDNDGLMQLIQIVDDHLRKHPLISASDAKWIGSANGDDSSPMFSIQDMEERRVFVGVLTVTYRVRR